MRAEPSLLAIDRARCPKCHIGRMILQPAKLKPSSKTMPRLKEPVDERNLDAEATTAKEGDLKRPPCLTRTQALKESGMQKKATDQKRSQRTKRSKPRNRGYAKRSI